jgi:L-rhamnose-H+ transport protein
MEQVFGIFLCMLGGLGVGIFLLPLKFSKSWTWENSWLLGTLCMYLIFPLVEAQLFVPGFLNIFRAANSRDIWIIYLFGLVQGTGALAFTYGITLMGLSLGYSLMISLNAAVGVLVPLIVGHPEQILTTGGVALIVGVVVLILGVCFSGRAGQLRERAVGAQAKMSNFGLGILIALYSGIANSFFYFSFEFQKSLKTIATQQFGVKSELWPIVNVIPLFTGMFTINLAYCLFKLTKDHAFRNYWEGRGLVMEYFLAISIGLCWFLGQGVCYTMGFTMLGGLGVPVGAAIFMGAIIVVSTLLGLRTGEWAHASPRILRLMYTGIVLEVLAVFIVGFGNHFMISK